MIYCIYILSCRKKHMKTLLTCVCVNLSCKIRYDQSCTERVMGLQSPHFGELSEYRSYSQEKAAVCRPNFPETCSCLFLMILSVNIYHLWDLYRLTSLMAETKTMVFQLQHSSKKDLPSQRIPVRRNIGNAYSGVLLMVTSILVHSNHYPYPLLALKKP